MFLGYRSEQEILDSTDKFNLMEKNTKFSDYTHCVNIYCSKYGTYARET
jgi:hypothetical protein